MTSKAKPAGQNKTERRWSVLREKLAAHASLLAEQGVLTLKTMKGRRYWYLRYMLPADEAGRRRHGSVYVGREADREIVGQVRQLLQRYRDRRLWIKEVASYARFAASVKMLALRQVRGLSRFRKARAET